MDEFQRQNEVERWRNKLRLQEKYQVRPQVISSSLIIVLLSRLAIFCRASSFSGIE